MKKSITEKETPNYVIVSIAIVQSELYWFCSVLYFVFRESGLLIEQAAVSSTKRNRSISAPPTTTTTIEPFKNSEFVALKDLDAENEDVIPCNQRRFSLPIIETVNIRERPTIKDEQLGNTCPPIIWQKLRVKLGHAPVHGDPKPIRLSKSVSTTTTITPSMISSPSLSDTSLKQFDSIDPSILSSNTLSPPLSETSSRSPPSSIFSFSKSASISSNDDNISLHRPQQKLSTKRKIISKLNSAFHLRKSKSSTDLKANKTM